MRNLSSPLAALFLLLLPFLVLAINPLDTRAVAKARKTSFSSLSLADARLGEEEDLSSLTIVINEILPSPEGEDAREEWIEISNRGDSEIDLYGWRITDTGGKINTYTFPLKTKIAARGFLTLSRPTSKITLNNDSDGLNLIQPDEKIIDSISYQKAPQGESFNRTESGWIWSKTLTPGAANVTPRPALKIKESEAPTKEVNPGKENLSGKELATIEEQIPGEFFSPLLIGLSIAIFSGVIILILKKKTEKF